MAESRPLPNGWPAFRAMMSIHVWPAPKKETEAQMWPSLVRS
jgi:hypothetical protein